MSSDPSSPAGDPRRDNAFIHATQVLPCEEVNVTKQRTKASAESEARLEGTSSEPPTTSVTSQSVRHRAFRAFQTIFRIPLAVMMRVFLPFTLVTLLTSIIAFLAGYHIVIPLLAIINMIRPTALAFIPPKTLARSIDLCRWRHLRNTTIGAEVLGVAIGLYSVLFTLVVSVVDKIQTALVHRTSVAEEAENEEEQPTQLSPPRAPVSIFVDRSAVYMVIIAEVIAFPFGNQLAAWYEGEGKIEAPDLWLALVIGMVGAAAWRVCYAWWQKIQKRKAAKPVEATSASDTDADAAQAKEADAEKTSKETEVFSMV